jgi:hypothetical protein
VTALEVGQLAQELFHGYMAYAGLSTLIARPQSIELIEQLESENSGPAAVPIEPIFRNDGSAHFFSLSHAVRVLAAEPGFLSVRNRLWLAGALLTLGDALATENYFDHGPDLEFVRHLRNGVAHGNRFHFHGEPRRPAHFTGPDCRLLADGVTSTPPGQVQTFEITATLEGQPVLCDYVGAGDLCDLLLFVANRLIRIGNGDPPSPLWPQHPR